MRDVPETPSNYYIVRQDLVYQICYQLKNINSNKKGGLILVHGMAGSGKTITVGQSVRLAVEECGFFRPQGVYWVKIGVIVINL